MKRTLCFCLLLGFVSSLSAQAPTNPMRSLAKHVDPGGHFYMLWNPDELRNRLVPMVLEFWNVAKAQQEHLGPEAEMGAQFAARAYRESGLEEFGGLGMSSVLQDDGKVLGKTFALREGPADRLLWQLWSPEEDKLTGLRMLPNSTAFGVYGEYRLDAMWGWVKKITVGTPAADALAEGQREAKANGIDIDRIFRSLDGDWGYALTLDPVKTMPMPGAPPGLDVPVPGFIAIANVSEPILFQTIVEAMQKQGAKPKIESVDDGQIFTMPVPDGAPFPLAPTLHYSKKQILFASTPELMKEMLENRRSAKTSILRDANFRKLATPRVVNANQIQYFNPRLSEELAKILQTMSKDAPPMKSLHDVLFADGEPFGFLSSIKSDADGISVHTMSTQRGIRAWLMRYAIPQLGPQMAMFGAKARQPMAVPLAPPPQLQVEELNEF